jgi:hypothetical protein
MSLTSSQARCILSSYDREVMVNLAITQGNLECQAANFGFGYEGIKKTANAEV